MHIDRLDLNLLRIFAAVHRARSVSQAARVLDIAQPVASQGVARLRRSLGDALFVRVGGGVEPTPLADRLMPTVEAALHMLEQALAEREAFHPAHSRRLFRLHMSDIGESRALPPVMARLRLLAPQVRVETLYVPLDQLPTALDTGRVDFAFGALAALKGMRSLQLTKDRYQIVVSRDHPLAYSPPEPNRMDEALRQLHFVAVRTHADTTRLLRLLRMDDHLMLTVEHFTALPAIVRASDLAAVVPMAIGMLFPAQDFVLIEPNFPMDDYTVGMYWSQRFESEPAHRWFREVISDCLVTNSLMPARKSPVAG